ncbi:uncharacterized protein LOC110263750 [Arachis ipaensis]|uniref:uncharacterized protein LOC110263750 n=1 Tax=Arachis ipaensis TaxID=130454 RepID=UPI000A2B539B|nr:uncharacterized protein LOC110263750 [Arachis ipaensis]
MPPKLLYRHQNFWSLLFCGCHKLRCHCRRSCCGRRNHHRSFCSLIQSLILSHGSSSGNCGSRLKLPPNRFVDRRCSVQPFFIRSGGRIRFVYAACSCFCFREGASRAEVLIVGDFGLSKKESVNKFGLSF